MLASKDFKERDAATKLLSAKKGLAVAEALKIALKGDDLEVRERVKFVIAERARKADQRALQRLAALTKEGAADQVAELLARWPGGREEEACWKHVYALVERIVVAHDNKFGISNAFPCMPGDAGRIKVVTGKQVVGLPRFRDQDSAFLSFFVRGQSLELDGNHVDSLAVGTSGSVKLGTFDGGAAILACGPVEIREWIAGWDRQCLVISDEDITVKMGGRTLFIARGNVTCEGLCKGATIICGKKVIVGERGSVNKTKLVENESTPLGLIKWFDPAREGIDAEETKGGVRVKAADAAKPFAKAGLQKGDLITAIDGTAVESYEQFRRLLRRGLAHEDGLILRVRREDKELDLPVDCPW
jgi:hypothetical protein